MTDIISKIYGNGNIVDVGVDDIVVIYNGSPNNSYKYSYYIAFREDSLYFYDSAIKKICMSFTDDEDLVDENIKKSFCDDLLREKLLENIKQNHCVSEINNFIYFIELQKNKNEVQKYRQEIENSLERSFTDEQIAAIFNDDDASLIVAGAGCGKTTTALGKIVYLVKSGKAKLEEILPIYFNNKNVDEMNDKIIKIFGNTKKIAYDYHQLGNKFLKKSYARPPEDPIGKIFNKTFNKFDNEQKYFLDDKKIDDLMCRIFDFMVRYMYTDDERAMEIFPKGFDDLSVEKKVEALEDDCLTLKGEPVGSPAEAVIANFLFTHKIPYTHEKNFKSRHPDAYPIYPDFYVPLGDGTNPKNAIWIEHWGIVYDSRGNERVRWLDEKGEKKYIEDKKQKLAEYKTFDAKLIELFLSDFKDDTLIDKLKAKLEEFGVDTSREMTRDEKIECIKELIKKRKLESIKNLVQRCIELLKINNHRSDDIAKVHKNALFGLEKREKERVKNLYRIVWCVMREYETWQKKDNFIDFTDMLIKARAKIADADLQYKYIIIDEYQDIDDLNYELISAIQKKTNAKICCVGDDWQAIYRFKGGNLEFFSDFGRYFPNFKTYRIQQTFRNGAPLIDIAGKFIQKNNNQQKKTIRSDKTTFLTAVLYHEFEGFGKYKDVDRLNCLFDILNQPDKDNFLIIVRNKSDFNKYFDIDCLGENCKDFSDVQEALRRKFPQKQIDVRTAHSSKGLEYDYVVVFNTAFKVTGFPSLLDDDPAISFLLPNKEDFPFAEERRLFYVALTRAKKGCYLLVPKFAPSQFFTEIEADIGKSNIIESYNATLATCPWCGKEMERNIMNNFYVCSGENCKYSTPKVFVVKNCDNVEFIIKKNREEQGQERPSAIYIYDKNNDKTYKADYKDIKNSATDIDSDAKNRKIDIYIVFDDLKDYGGIKKAVLSQLERNVVALNFSEKDLDDNHPSIFTKELKLSERAWTTQKIFEQLSEVGLNPRDYKAAKHGYVPFLLQIAIDGELQNFMQIIDGHFDLVASVFRVLHPSYLEDLASKYRSAYGIQKAKIETKMIAIGYIARNTTDQQQDQMIEAFINYDKSRSHFL